MERVTPLTAAWRRVEFALFVLLLCTPLVWSPWPSTVSWYKGYFVNLMACLLAASLLLRFPLGLGAAFRFAWVDGVLALFLLLAGASALWCTSVPVMLQRYALLVSFGLAFLFVRVRMEEGGDPWVYLRIMLGIAACVALVDSAALWQANRAGGAEGFKTGSQLFSHQNVASLYSVAPVPLALAALLMERRLWRRLLLGAVLAALSGYLFLLQSRASWVEVPIACAGVVLCAALRRKGRRLVRFAGALLGRRWLIVALAVLLVLACLLPLSRDFSTVAKTAFMKAVSAFDLNYQRHFFRVDIWRKTMSMVADHPWLGVGLGNFPVVFPLYHRMEQAKAHPHNEYFNVLVELGVVGMLLYALALLLIFRAFLRAFQSEDRRTRYAALGLGGALGVELLHGFVEPPMIFEASGLNLWIFAGILVGLESRLGGAAPRRFAAGGWVRRLLFAAGALVMLAPTAWLIPAFNQGIQLNQGNIAFSENRYADAEAHFRRVNSLGWPNYYTCIILGDACLRQKKDAEALKAFEAAERLFPNYYVILYRKGQVLRLLGRLEDAKASLERCLYLNRDFEPATTEMVRVLFQMKQYDEAFRLLRVYMRSRKPNREDYRLAGQFYQQAYFLMDRPEKERLRMLSQSLRYFEAYQQAGGDAKDVIARIRAILDAAEKEGDSQAPEK